MEPVSRVMMDYIYSGLDNTFEVFHGAYHYIIPESLHQLELEVVVAGLTCGYISTRAIQASAKVIDKYIPGTYEKALPIAEKIGRYGMLAGMLTYVLLNPQDLAQKPRHLIGLLSLYVSGNLAINSRKRNDELDKEIFEFMDFHDYDKKPVGKSDFFKDITMP